MQTTRVVTFQFSRFHRLSWRAVLAPHTEPTPQSVPIDTDVVFAISLTAGNPPENLLEGPLLFSVTRLSLQGFREVPQAENVPRHGGRPTTRLINWSSLSSMLSVGHSPSGGGHG